jgi:STE24 endopeptidase
MGTTEAPPLDLSNKTGRAYTKHRTVVAELQFLGQVAAIIAYGFFGLQQGPVEIARAITNNFYMQVAICWLPLWLLCVVCSLPFSFYSFYLNRRFGLTKSTLSGWLWDLLKANALVFVFGGVLLEVIFATNLLSSSWGWMLAGVLCSLLFMGVSRLLPWLMSLFYPVVPLADGILRDGLIGLARKAGIRVGAVYEWRISARTRQANAFVSGVGRARRITLTDTLLQELSPEEVEAIVAHELGHYAHHHIWKRVLLQVPIFCGIFGVISLIVQTEVIWFAETGKGWADLKLIPGLFFLWQIGYVYGRLIVAALARKQEKEADLFGWKLMSGSKAFISAMQKLTALNLVVFDKGTQWKYQHPPTADRIAAAAQFERDASENLEQKRQEA